MGGECLTLAYPVSLTEQEVPWRSKVIEMDDAVVRTVYIYRKNKTAKDTFNAASKMKAAAYREGGSLHEQDGLEQLTQSTCKASMAEMRSYITHSGRNFGGYGMKYEDDLPPLYHFTPAEGKLLTSSQKTKTLNQEWCKPTGGKHNDVVYTEKDTKGRAGVGYLARYKRYEAKVDEWNEWATAHHKVNPSYYGMGDKHTGFQLETKRPFGTAACISPTMSLPEQYEELRRHRDEGLLKMDTQTKPVARITGPRESGRPYFEWSTNEYRLVEGKSVSCWQAAMVAFTTLELCTLGIPPATPAPREGESFLGMERILDCSHFPIFRLLRPHMYRQMETIYDLFKVQFGMFVIFCYVYHNEDIDVPQKDTEGVPHYIVWNATIGLLQLYPETIVLEDEDRHSPSAIADLLAQDPNYIRLRTETGTLLSDVRQVYVDPNAPRSLTLPHSNMTYAKAFTLRGKRPRESTAEAMDLD